VDNDGVTATTVRRTQAERTATTRALLLDTTVACLAELGHAGTTTTEVAKRSGLSRGAQLHHFPTKAELVAAAVEHLFARRLEEFRVAFARVPDGADRVGAAIDLLWSMFRGETFEAWLELAVAARTDPELHQHVARVSQDFNANVDATFRELFPPPADGPTPFYEMAPSFLFALFEGLAINRLAGGTADDRPEQVIASVKALATLVFPSQ
jgi:AcrR family transcriptional regulator